MSVTTKKRGTSNNYGSAKTLKSKIIEENRLLQNSQDRGALFFNYGGDYNASTGILNNSFSLNETTISENTFYYVSNSGNKTIYGVSEWKKGDIFFYSRGRILIIPFSGIVSDLESNVGDLLDLRAEFQDFKFSVLKTFHNLLVGPSSGGSKSF